MKRIYLAGPMSGLKDFNYPAFNAVAYRLRQQGFHVENPAKNPVPICGSWQGYMRLALTQLITCDMAYFLPGWRRSKGARLEFKVAVSLGLAIVASPVSTAKLPVCEISQTATEHQSD